MVDVCQVARPRHGYLLFAQLQDQRPRVHAEGALHAVAARLRPAQQVSRNERLALVCDRHGRCSCGVYSYGLYCYGLPLSAIVMAYIVMAYIVMA